MITNQYVSLARPQCLPMPETFFGNRWLTGTSLPQAVPRIVKTIACIFLNFYICNCITNATQGAIKKTATIPSLRVDPELRHAAENILKKGEPLSSFVVQSLHVNIERRRLHKEFVTRGLASRNEARKTGEYYDADNILANFEKMLSKSEDQ